MYLQIKESQSSVTICNTSFRENSSPLGGGASIALEKSVSNVHIVIADCTISQNSAKSFLVSKGGGIHLEFDTGIESCNNSVTLSRVLFSKNNASSGGGMSVLSKTVKSNSGNKVHLVNCTWFNNTASSGAAMAITTNVGKRSKSGFIQTQFVGCIFNSNHIRHFWFGTSVGIGALFIKSIDILFVNTVLFSGNSGSGIAAIDSVLHFNTTAAIFKHNIAFNGGAILLLNFAHISLYPKSKLVFIANKAINCGGAIYSQLDADHQVLLSSLCAIQYFGTQHISPDDWESQIIFVDNFAQDGRKRNCIYVSSLRPCQMAYSVNRHEIVNEEHVFGFTPFRFTSFDWTSETQGDCSRYTPLTPDVSITPGKKGVINFTILDEYNNTINNSVLKRNPAGNQTTCALQSQDVIYLPNELEDNFTQCPPAYIFIKPNCTCEKDRYFGIAECVVVDGQVNAKIFAGVWAGYLYDNSTSTYSFVTAQCSFFTCDLGNDTKEILPIYSGAQPQVYKRVRASRVSR